MYARIARHWGLMNAMAGRSGVDLGMAYLDGAVGRDALRGAIFACAGCQNVRDCEALLDRPCGPDDPIPDYCLNRALIQRLRPVEA